jgi:hypothetical protein
MEDGETDKVTKKGEVEEEREDGSRNNDRVTKIGAMDEERGNGRQGER